MAVKLFVRPGKSDGKAEAGGKAHQLLHGIRQMNLVAFPVGEGLLHQMTAVGCGVDREVGTAAADTCLLYTSRCV